MTPLDIGLAAALGVAVAAIVVLAVRASAERQRVRNAAYELGQTKARLTGEEQARAALATEIRAVLGPFRTLLEQQAGAIIRATGNLGAAVTANGQRIRDLDVSVTEAQTAIRALIRASDELAVVRGDTPPTRVAGRGSSIAPPAASGAQRHPSIAPPGSATVLAPEPAQVAAGLGPRPISRPIAGRATPHPPPVRAGAAPRSATLLGIAAPATANAALPESADSGEWRHADRPWDADGERTRVGARPSPEALGLSPRPVRAAATTLVSMQAVPSSDGDGGGS